MQPLKKPINPIVQLVEPEIKELVSKKNWRALKDAISDWLPQDIADLISTLSPEEGIILFRLLPKQLQSQVFAEFDPETQGYIIRNLTSDQVKAVLAELDPDDRTELFEELPPDLTKTLLNLLSPEDRRETLQLLGYPKDSVGRLMTPDYVTVRPEMAVREALEHIRRRGLDAETIDVVYVVDRQGRLLDDLPLRKLILADPDQRIESLMDYKVISINATEDQEEAVKLFERYDLLALPVTDSEGYLLGIVTVDDIIDVLTEEQTEDFTKFMAIEAQPIGLDFITRLKEIPLRKLYRSRVLWLLLLVLMNLLTGGIIQQFESTIARYVVLVTFLPVIIDSAGNAGSQAATLVIRGMAVGTIQVRDWLVLLGRELLVASALGLTMGVGISFIGIFRGGPQIAKVVATAMVLSVVTGSLTGVLLPFLLARFRHDPATASTPLITTLADIMGTAVYLGVAHIMLS